MQKLPTLEMADSSVDALKRQARSLEHKIEALLTQFGHLDAGGTAARPAAAADPEGGGLEAERALVREIEDNLQQLSDVTERIAAGVADRVSTADTAMVKRWREVLLDFKTMFRNQLAALRTKREKAALFRDLRDAKAASSADAAAADALLRERGSLTQSNRVVDEMLAQAAATRDSLARQRQSLMGSMTGVGSLMTRLPVVGDVIAAVQQRRVFNDRVVAVVIALGICFFVWLLVLRPS